MAPNGLKTVFSLSQKPSRELMQEEEFRQQEAHVFFISLALHGDWNVGGDCVPVHALTCNRHSAGNVNQYSPLQMVALKFYWMNLTNYYVEPKYLSFQA